MPIAWNDDPPGSEQRILANVEAVLAQIAADADKRHEPSVAAAQEWHRRIYAGVELPVPYYAGEPRDSDPRFPELQRYEVRIGAHLGTPSAQVPQALDSFERQARRAVVSLDEGIPAGGVAADTFELHGILSLCAVLHGEWVRIHPFANGNGRTARLWANWAALRFGLPAFVTPKPRPSEPYGVAAMASMSGNHAVAVAAFHELLRLHMNPS